MQQEYPTSTASLVKQSFLEPNRRLPLLVEPAAEGVDLVAWATAHRDDLEKDLLQHGGILFRGFDGAGPARLDTFIRALSGAPLQYSERSSPRSQVEGNIYTSTDYPADQSIAMHCENSYAARWPRRIFFHCVVPPEEGGETPLADVRRVYERIDPALREQFRQRKVLYLRNYREGLGLSWQTVYQTSDPAEVEARCRAKGIDVEWKAGGQLRTRAVREAVVRHPQTNEWIWFNHAMFFHASSLAPEIRDGLKLLFKEDELPANTFYGTGEPIDDADVAQIRRAYEAEAVSFPWQRGDVLMLDNMLVSHSRRPFKGVRNVLVGMAEPMQWSDLER